MTLSRSTLEKIAKVCLVVAVLVHLSGYAVLCYCPGWYAAAAGFALFPVCLGAGRVRVWGAVFLVASLIMMATQFRALRIQNARVRETIERSSKSTE